MAKIKVEKIKLLSFLSLKNKSIFYEIVILLLIMALSVLTFILILSNPQAREIFPSGAQRDTLAGRHSFSFQSTENIKFINGTSLASSIKGYYKAWPPGYPTILYLFNKIKIQPLDVNLLIYFFNMIWFYYYLKKINVSLPVTFLIFFSYSFGAFHYYNLAIQVVSEGLFILMAHLIFTMTAIYSKENNFQIVVWLSLLTSFSILVKYFGLLWLFPVVSICIFVFSKNNFTRFKNLLVYGIVSILPTVPWFIWIFKTTGYLSGWNRFQKRGIEHLTDLKHNVYFTLKTFYVDFLSRDWASHITISGKYDLTSWDLVVFVLLTIIAGSICKILYDLVKEKGYFEWKAIRGFIKDEGMLFLLILFSGSYLVVILSFWTKGNNDPIYSRFLYPSYPFIILTIAKIYELFMKKFYHRYYAVVFNAFFIAMLASHIYKTIMLNNRYMIL